MATYNYTREIDDGKYNINNQYCVDSTGKQVFLFTEIKDETTLPNDFKITASNSSCDIVFNVTLDDTQQTTLNTIVAAHKAHTGA